jgi:hypothetical protein
MLASGGGQQASYPGGDRGDRTFGFFSLKRSQDYPRDSQNSVTRVTSVQGQGQPIWTSSSNQSTTRVLGGPPRCWDGSAPGWPFRAERLADRFLETVDGKGFREDGHTRYAEEAGVVQ